MNVSEYINKVKKRPWTRRVATDTGGYELKVMTQDDFLNEVNAAAHKINTPMMSRRPIYGPTGQKDKNGKDAWGIVDYDTVETVPVSKQEEIITKKISHFSADGFWVASETDDEERFGTLMSWFDSVGCSTAFTEVVRSVFRTGDGAVYIYQTDDPDNPIDYEVYGYETGSTLFPRVDIDGKRSLARKYKFNGHDAVDIFTTEKIEIWMKLDDKGDEDVIPIEGREKSEDGYTLVRRKESQAGSRLCQCVYFRVDDIPTGPVQLQCDKLEDGKTYIGEHLKGTSMPILFVKAEKTTSLPPSSFANKVMGVKGSADSLAHSDAKFLAPPDASNIATIHLGGLEEDIRNGAMSVKISPDVLKQGADSSATMKILYAPEIQWAQVHWPDFFKSVKQFMSVFKALVGKVESDPVGYDSLRISVGQNIWIPQNAAEALKMELDSVYGRIKSRKSAMQDAGNRHKGDYEQITKEWKEELWMKAEAPAKAKAMYNVEAGDSEDGKTNPGNVNNQAPGKSIQN